MYTVTHQFSVRSVVVRRQPLLAVDEVDGEVLGRLVLGELPRPRHALGRVGARPSAVVLCEQHVGGAAWVPVAGPPGRVDGLGEVHVGEDDARVGVGDAAEVHLPDAIHLALEEHEAAAVLLLAVLRGDGTLDLRSPVGLHEDIRTLDATSRRVIV
jgi:hypothetical protein